MHSRPICCAMFRLLTASIFHFTLKDEDGNDGNSIVEELVEYCIQKFQKYESIVPHMLVRSYELDVMVHPDRWGSHDIEIRRICHKYSLDIEHDCFLSMATKFVEAVQYTKAAKLLSELLLSYPDTNIKISASLLLADCYNAMNMKEYACGLYQSAFIGLCDLYGKTGQGKAEVVAFDMASRRHVTFNFDRRMLIIKGLLSCQSDNKFLVEGCFQYAQDTKCIELITWSMEKRKHVRLAIYFSTMDEYVFWRSVWKYLNATEEARILMGLGRNLICSVDSSSDSDSESDDWANNDDDWDTTSEESSDITEQMQTIFNYSEQLLKHAYNIVSRMQDNDLIVEYYSSMGYLYARIGDKTKAKQYYSLARQSSKNTSANIILDNNIAVMSEDMDGTSFHESSMQLFEKLVTNSKRIRDKFSIVDHYGAIFDNCIVTAIENSNYQRALEILEKGRASLLKQHMQSTVEPYSKELKFTDMLNIAKEHNAYLLNYAFIGRHYFTPGSSLYIFLVTPDGELIFKEMDYSDIENKLTNLYNCPDMQTNFERIEKDLRSLYCTLIEPVSEHLPKNPDQLVLLFSNDVISCVSFNALITPRDTFLVEEYTMACYSCLKQLIWSKQFAASDTIDRALYIDGSDDLETESGILESVRLQVKVPKPCVRDVVVRELQNQYPLVHISGHIVVSSDDLEDQYILGLGEFKANYSIQMADGVPLTCNDIYSLDLSNTALVFMTNCNPLQGKITRDYVYGIPRALIQSGVPSVIGSVWPVLPKIDTFLTKTYQYLLNDRRNKPAAIRRAILDTYITPKRNQLSLTRDTSSIVGRMNVRYWGGFLVLGWHGSL